MKRRAGSQNKLLLDYIAEKVKENRLRMEISQEELAMISGVHRTYIGFIERGEKNITLETLHKICDAMGVSLAEIFQDFTQKGQGKVEQLRKLRGY